MSREFPNRRVVVTGMGAVTPMGLTRAENWDNLVHGRSGIRRISIFDPEGFPTQIAGEVRGFDFAAEIARDPALAEARRATFFALRAAEEALRESGLRRESLDPERFGIYFGTGDSGLDFEAFAKSVHAARIPDSGAYEGGRYLEAAPSHASGLLELESQPLMTLSHLVRRFSIAGPAANSITACAASSQAIGEAFEWIKRGDADIMMTGGSHAMVYPLGIAGFSLLTALSTRNDAPENASRPFDRNRDGFVLSEGACALILEDLEHARRRGAVIFGEITGYGATADAYRMTDMDPEGRGACRAVTLAMQKAGLKPEDVDYINAHGTATQVNDAIETLVIKKVMGERAVKIPISSIKSMAGHMIAAAGAFELIACLEAIGHSLIPPTINYDEPDPKCDLDYVPNQARAKKVRTALSNSFGFGGQNICLAVRAYAG